MCSGALGRGDGREPLRQDLKEPSAPALDLLLPAVPGASWAARRSIRTVARGHVADLHAVELAVSEAVTNAVIHAYRQRDGAEPGHVHIKVSVDGDFLVVDISDEGMGMVPREDSPGAGLGLAMMATLADHFEVRERRNGTALVLGFRLADPSRSDVSV